MHMTGDAEEPEVVKNLQPSDFKEPTEAAAPAAPAAALDEGPAEDLVGLQKQVASPEYEGNHAEM